MTELEKYNLVNNTNTLLELSKAIETIIENTPIEDRDSSEVEERMIDLCVDYEIYKHDVLTKKYGIRQQAFYIERHTPW